mmetsp:Transcript_36620/g.91319  ORF Transcript_36620/g.91319 Transcript_36620/m.91319 type:complete len:143 (+) Transcript_36620:36-464(+)
MLGALRGSGGALLRGGRLAAAPGARLSSSAGGYILMDYGYVEGMLVKRAPHRAAHLAHWQPEFESGAIRLAGAYSPAEDALFIFYGTTREWIEARAQTDPYCVAGLVTSVKTKEWSVVAGADFSSPQGAPRDYATSCGLILL